jgi:hypothetical protein
MNILKTLMASAILSVSTASAALAALATTTGVWTSPLVTDAIVTGVGTDIISWGTPEFVGGPQSSYGFDGATGVTATTDGTLFELGDFIHNNQSIFSTGAGFLGANLSITLNVDGDIGLFTYLFSHIETPNFATPCAFTGVLGFCDDKVSVSNLIQTDSVVIGGNGYILEVVGFSTDGGLSTIPDFLTKESKVNLETLFGRLKLVSRSVDVAEPAGFALLGLGLLTLGIGHRSNRRYPKVL